MSPTVPISRFVDEEHVEPSPPAQPTDQVGEELTDWGAMSPEELAEQIRAQLEECGPMSPAELAEEQRMREEIRAAEMLERARHGKPETPAEAKRCSVSEETVSPSTPSRKKKWRPRTAWAKEYHRLYRYPYPPDFYVFRCGARTRAGTPCKRRPDFRNGRCKLHGGASTGPKTEQGRRQSAENGRKGGRPRKRVAGQESKT